MALFLIAFCLVLGLFTNFASANYGESCYQITIRDELMTLRAVCGNRNGVYAYSDVELGACIWNNDGILTWQEAGRADLACKNLRLGGEYNGCVLYTECHTKDQQCRTSELDLTDTYRLKIEDGKLKCPGR